MRVSLHQRSLLPLAFLPLAMLCLADAPAPVKLSFDYGDGAQKSFAVSYTSGGTVRDVMDAARKIPPGLDYTATGDGETSFISAIDGVSNEGSGRDKRNWLYWVDEKFADKSFGAYKLDAGDRVQWKFGVQTEPYRN